MRRIALAWIAATSLAACRPDCAPDRAGASPIVLLVTVDTLRADHLGSYGSARARTPALDRLAAEGVRFERTYAAANTTLPSHASLFTSLPIARHGVLSNARGNPRPADTVHGSFRAAGYRTGAFVSAFHLRQEAGLGALLTGFEHFEAPARVSKPRPAAGTVDATLDWIRASCRGPAFGWVHLWDPHMPYAPPDPFDDAYWTGDPRRTDAHSLEGAQYDWALLDMSKVRRRLWRRPRLVRSLKQRLGLSSRLARRVALSPPELRRRAPDRATYDALLAELRPVLAELHRELPFNRLLAAEMLSGVRDVEYPRALYAGEVSYVDAELGRLIATLETWGLRDRLVVVLTADHGEQLGEHDIYFNHIGLWEQTLRVPLVVWAPGRVAPAVRTDFASGLDVAPTLLGLARLDKPAPMRGRDLLDGTPPPDAVVSEASLGRQVMLRTGDWKLVRTLHDYYATTAFHREAGLVELYDLAHDPAERTNLATVDQARTHELSARLDTWMDVHGIARDGTLPAAPPISPAERDRLRALGYVE